MKLLLTSALLGLCTVTFSQQAQRLAWFDFAEQNSWQVIEKISGKAFKVRSNFSQPEFVKGVEGKAVRLDGYSTSIGVKLNKSFSIPFTLSGWFALETFPTDTAGFFAISDEGEKNGVSATVDQLGNPLIGLKENGKFRFVAGTGVVEKFKWFHVGLVADQSGYSLWINHEKVVSASLKANVSRYLNISLGKDQREKFTYRYFPSSHINGLVDEVMLWDVAFNERHFALISDRCRTLGKPNLSIPSSRFAKDFNRPQYHLLPAANWTNETHGLIFYKNRYHIFNQKNGNNLFLGQINWGHFSSPDLLHWTEHKPALTPDRPYDSKGIWSGHVIEDKNGRPVAFYTGSDGEQHCINIAFPKDDLLIGWEKFDGNPVIKNKPSQFSRTDMRDPYLWKEGDKWYMIIGYGVIEDEIEKGSLLLYISDDLINWKFVHTLFTGEPDNDDSGVFWEMPVFWRFDEKYILLVNKVPHKGRPAVALYWVGDFKNERFIPDEPIPQKLELINRLLSPSVSLDEKGRTVAIAIIPDETTAEAQLKQGWTHVYSIPREWNLKNGRLVQTPLPEMVSLRGNHKAISSTDITNRIFLDSGHHQVELKLKLKPAENSRFGLVIGKSHDGSESTKIIFDVVSQKLVVDQSNSTTRPFIRKDIREAAFKIEKDKDLDLHVFIDGSVIEIFVNGEAFTTRIFPDKKSSSSIELFIGKGNLKLIQGDIWHLQSPRNKTDL